MALPEGQWRERNLALGSTSRCNRESSPLTGASRAPANARDETAEDNHDDHSRQHEHQPPGQAARPVRFVDLFQGRDELVVYHSMWYDGARRQGQCEGCTFNLWHMGTPSTLNARGASFALLTSGR